MNRADVIDAVFADVDPRHGSSVYIRRARRELIQHGFLPLSRGEELELHCRFHEERRRQVPTDYGYAKTEHGKTEKATDP